jgi:hypothetical protein
MMDKLSVKNIASIIWGIVLLVVLLSWLSGCTLLHKITHKQKSRVDSSYISHGTIDSTANADSSHFIKSYVNTVSASDTSKKGEVVVIKERKKILEYDTAGKLRKATYLNKQTTNITQEQAGFHIDFLQGGNLDSSTHNNEIDLKKNTYDSGHVIRKQINKQEDKKRSFNILSLWWVLILIAIIITLYKNRSKLKLIIAKILTGI